MNFGLVEARVAICLEWWAGVRSRSGLGHAVRRLRTVDGFGTRSGSRVPCGSLVPEASHIQNHLEVCFSMLFFVEDRK